jgi:hypothetical protein
VQPPDHQEFDHVQAHLYPARQMITFLLLLSVGSLAVSGTGCSSSEQTEYRQFSDKIDQSGQETVAASDAADSKSPAAQQNQQSATQPETRADATPEPAPAKQQTTTADNSPAKAEPTPTANQPAKQIRVEELALVARKPDPSQRALTEQEQKELAASEPREVKILVKDRSFRKVAPENVLLINYDDIDLLKVMNMEPVTPQAPELMPEWLKDLDGQRIRIRGFMYPPFQQTGNEFFQLARDNQICCFGKNPKIYDLFPVVMRDGVTTDYILNRPFDVVGVFHIKAETVDGELQRIYLIDDAIVIDK